VDAPSTNKAIHSLYVCLSCGHTSFAFVLCFGVAVHPLFRHGSHEHQAEPVILFIHPSRQINLIDRTVDCVHPSSVPARRGKVVWYVHPPANLLFMVSRCVCSPVLHALVRSAGVVHSVAGDTVLARLRRHVRPTEQPCSIVRTAAFARRSSRVLARPRHRICPSEYKCFLSLL
jgi:hypothetical protein